MFPPGWRCEIYDEIDSTQDVAVAAARAGAAGQLAIVAHRQTAGRGSRGRVWAAAEGNLYFSAMLRPESDMKCPGRWSLLAGLALFEVLAPYSNGLSLKWPNDVLRNGAKLGGILIESALRGDGGLDSVVIGVGANLKSAPNVAGRDTACLGAGAPDAVSIAAQLMVQLDAWSGVAMPELITAWVARAHPIGTWLDIVLAGRRVAGPFAGLDSDGALLIDGQAPVHSGEVFLAARLPAPCC